MHSPPPFPLLLLVLTGRCLDRGEGADGGRLVSTPPAPPEGSRLCTCWWRTQLSRLGLRSYFLKFAPYVCACLRVYISTCVCVCVCVFIHAYINIYIYVLTRISFPSGGELGGARGRLEEKLPVSAEPANWDGMGRDGQTPSAPSPSRCPFLSLPTNPLPQLPCGRRSGSTTRPATAKLRSMT